MIWKKSELPLVQVLLIFRKTGILSDNATSGLVFMTANMLDEGAGELNALQFGDKMQSLGAEFSTFADHESIRSSLTVLKRNFDAAAGLMADAIRRPRFDPPEWDRVKRLHLEELKEQEDQPGIVAPRVAARMLFGEKHAYGRPVVGIAETVEKFTLDDVRARYKAFVRPELATILIAGDLTAGEAKSALERHFGDWKAEPAPAPLSPDHAMPSRNELEVVLVDRPDAVQTVVQFIMPGPKYTTSSRAQYRLLDTILGGSFTSRLMQNLREQKGYTYGARSSFVMRPTTGFMTATASVRADVTGESIQEFLKELQGIRGGDVTDDEAGKARETLRTDTIQSFAGLGGVLAEAAERLSAGLPFESLNDDLAAMQSTAAKDLNQLAEQAIPLNKGVLVLVGDKKTVLEEIKELALPKPIEVNVRGDRVGS